MREGAANLSVLRARGIGSGLSVFFPGVYLNSEVRAWVSACRAVVENAWREMGEDRTYIAETFIREGVLSRREA